MAGGPSFFPTARIGTYELASRLGRGYVSEVWLAYRPAGDGRMQAMALKRLHHPAPALQASFSQALRSATVIDHPNVVHVFSAFEHDERSVAVLELIDGLSVHELIADRVRREGRVEPKLAVWIARECLRAAYDVQSQVTGTGSEHGHLRAGNVLLSRDGVVKVSDFILARVTNDRRLVGELAREAERDAVSIARLLLALWLGRRPEDLPGGALEAAADLTGRASIGAFVRRCLAPDSGNRLRELEEDLGRIFYAELEARELADGTPAVAALVRSLLPAIDEERARLDADGFKPSTLDTLHAAPTIATRASFGLTEELAARDAPVVPSPLTRHDIPTGFTRDLSVAGSAIRVPSDAVLGVRPSTSVSEASTDEDLPASAAPPTPARPKADFVPPARPAGAETRPPPAQSSTSKPGRVTVTQSTELKLGWFRGTAQLALGFSAGVLVTALVALYHVTARAPATQVLPEPLPAPTLAPAPVVAVPNLDAPSTARAVEASDLETRIARLGSLAPESEERRVELSRVAQDLGRELAEARVDARTRQRIERLIAEGLERQDPASLSRALRSLRAPRTSKLAPVESL